MGGALAVRTMEQIEKSEEDSELKKAIRALVVIDVVEETAMEALPYMENFVKNRPSDFPDLRSVVRYGIVTG